MQKDENKKTGKPGDRPENTPEYIREFIERKRLENRILQGILDKINQAEPVEKFKTTKKEPKE
jgi:hypothetical protein